MALSVRELFLIVRAQNQASGTLNRVSRDMERLATSSEFAFTRASHAVGGLGRTLQFTGGAVVAGLGFAANAAAEFDSKMQLVGTQTGRTFGDIQKTVDQIMPEVLKQMSKFPASADDMSTALYDIFSSLDVTVKGGTRLLSIMNKAAVGGQVDLATVTDATISVMNDYGVKVSGVTDVMQTMFAAVRFGRMTFSEFANSFGQVVAPLSAAGQSFDVLAGTMAFLTRKIPSTAKASVALSRAVEVLGREKFIEGVRKAGVEITNLHGKLLPLPTIVDRLTRAFPKLKTGGTFLQQFLKSMSGTEGTIQARRALTFLFQDVSGYHKILGQVIDDNREFGRSSKALSQSTGVQWKVFLNTLKSFWLLLGQAVIPAFVELSKPVKELVKWMGELDKQTREQIGRWLVFISVGAVVTGTFLSISAAILGVAAVLAGIGANLLLFATVGATFAVMAAAAYLVMKNWKAVKPFIEKYWPSIVEKAKSAADALRPIVETFVKIVEDAVATISAFISGDWSKFWDRFAATVTDATKIAGLSIKAFSDLVLAYLKTMMSSIQGFIVGMAGLGLMFSKLNVVTNALPMMGGRSGRLGGGAAANFENGLLFAAPWASNRSWISRFKDTWKKRITVPMARAISQDQGVRLERMFSGLTRSKAGNLMGDAGTIEKIAAGNVKAAAGISMFTDAMAVASTMITSIPPTWAIAGAAIAGFAAIAILTADHTDKLVEETKKLKEASTAVKAYGQASDALNAVTQNSRMMNDAIAETKKQLSQAKGGTEAYQQALATLKAQQTQAAEAADRTTDAYKRLNKAASDANAKLKGVSVDTSLATLDRLQGIDFSSMTPTALGRGAVDQAYLKKQSDSAKMNIQKVISIFQEQMHTFAEAAASGRKLTDTEKTLMNTMGQMAEKHRGDIPGLAKMFNDVNDNAMALLKTLGRVPSDLGGFATFAGSIPKNLMPAIQAFTKLTGQLPSMPFAEMLQRAENAAKGAGKQLAVFVATMGRMPKKKEVDLYFKHAEPWYRRWFANFMSRFHRLPTKHEIKVEVDKHHQAEKRINEIRQHIRRLQSKQSAFAEAHGPITGGQDPFSAQITEAQRKLNRLKAPKLKGILRFTYKPGDPFKALPQKAGEARKNAMQKFNGWEDQFNGIGNKSGTAWGTGFTAKAKGHAHATVDIIINEFRKSAQITSPSKRFKKEVGDPILQGILAGIKNKDDIKSATDTAIDTMISLFNDKKSMFQDQMGSLFDTQNITDKVDWGEKLNIKDLTKSLAQQTHRFRKFQRDLRELAKKPGASPAFVEMLRNLGPEAQSELTALLNATPKQIKRYVALWRRSQGAINTAAKNAVHTQYRMWRAQGAAVALGFLQGMQDHSAQMARWIKNLFLGLLKQVKHAHKSHSPSRVYYQEGLNVAMGFKLGLADGMRGVTLASPEIRGKNHRHDHTHWHIHPGANQSQVGAWKRQEYLRRRRK